MDETLLAVAGRCGVLAALNENAGAAAITTDSLPLLLADTLGNGGDATFSAHELHAALVAVSTAIDAAPADRSWCTIMSMTPWHPTLRVLPPAALVRLWEACGFLVMHPRDIALVEEECAQRSANQSQETLTDLWGEDVGMGGYTLRSAASRIFSACTRPFITLLTDAYPALLHGAKNDPLLFDRVEAAQLSGEAHERLPRVNQLACGPHAHADPRQWCRSCACKEVLEAGVGTLGAPTTSLALHARITTVYGHVVDARTLVSKADDDDDDMGGSPNYNVIKRHRAWRIAMAMRSGSDDASLHSFLPLVSEADAHLVFTIWGACGLMQQHLQHPRRVPSHLLHCIPSAAIGAALSGSPLRVQLALDAVVAATTRMVTEADAELARATAATVTECATAAGGDPRGALGQALLVTALAQATICAAQCGDVELLQWCLQHAIAEGDPLNDEVIVAALYGGHARVLESLWMRVDAPISTFERCAGIASARSTADPEAASGSYAFGRGSVAWLVAAGVRIAPPGPIGVPAVVNAAAGFVAAAGDLSGLQAILEGAPLGYDFAADPSLLTISLQAGEMGVVRYLHSRLVDGNIRSWCGEGVWMAACMGPPASLEWLLSHRELPPLTSRYSQCTACAKAVSSGRMFEHALLKLRLLRSCGYAWDGEMFFALQQVRGGDAAAPLLAFMIENGYPLESLSHQFVCNTLSHIIAVAADAPVVLPLMYEALSYSGHAMVFRDASLFTSAASRFVDAVPTLEWLRSNVPGLKTNFVAALGIAASAMAATGSKETMMWLLKEGSVDPIPPAVVCAALLTPYHPFAHPSRGLALDVLLFLEQNHAVFDASVIAATMNAAAAFYGETKRLLEHVLSSFDLRRTATPWSAEEVFQLMPWRHRINTPLELWRWALTMGCPQSPQFCHRVELRAHTDLNRRVGLVPGEDVRGSIAWVRLRYFVHRVWVASRRCPPSCSTHGFPPLI